jgi:hypothetical protein
MATKRRGHAIVEFALVAPLLVLLVLYSIYFTELMQAKLKLLEAARFAAWEMTSFPLSDYGSRRHQEVFHQAAGDVAQATEDRYRHLDGRTPFGFATSVDTFQTTLSQTPIASSRRIDELSTGGTSEGTAWTSSIFSVARGGLGTALQKLGFNTQGQIRAQVSTAVVNRLLPQHLLDRDLTRLALEAELTLVADGWSLTDGADSVIRNGRAGQHRSGREPSGLYTQVRRMDFLGVREMLGAKVPVPAILGSFLPNPLGTYVVSHNYQPEPPGTNKAGCNYLQKYPPEAKAGLNNLQLSSKLDHQRPKCFDTSPFRDQAKYDDSLYIQMFKSRGDWFMGCKHPEAEVNCQ